MTPVRVHIALGSNLGDRAARLDRAVTLLAAAVDVDRRSAIYETAPQYVTDQPAFLNMAVSGVSVLEPHALMAVTQGIESALGRVKTLRFGPRAIDLDILFHGNTVLETPDLTIPHPRLAERRFVLLPLADIAPRLRHPVTGRTVEDMLAALPPDDGVRLFRPAAQN